MSRPSIPVLLAFACCATAAADACDGRAPARPVASSAAAGAQSSSSSSPPSDDADFVSTLMALTPSDPRAAPAQALLQSHFAGATQQGASATAALQSTFVTACLAPSAVSIGM